MNRWYSLAPLLAGLLAACGTEFSPQPEKNLIKSKEEIVGGSATTITENPWQVSLQSTGGSHFCGGSVINANWILTAQHCVNNGGTISTPGRVVAGSTKISTSGSGQIRTVAQVVVYPGYVDANKGKDVALLRLSSPLDLSGSSVKAIGLISAADATAGVTNPGVSARITGWGTLSSGGSSPDTLQTADVTILSNSSAQSSYPSETITADQLPAAAPGKDTCQGDSGGPLTVLKSGVRTLAGVTSWGYGCADPQYPGMYARVSSFESWINSTISGGGVTTLTDGVPLNNLSGSTGAQANYKITVPAGQSSLTVTISGGTGDADMYVKFGSQPTTSSYDCRPYLSGNGETCTFTNPAAGDWYIMLNAYSTYSGVTLVADYAAVGGDPYLTNGVPVTGISGAAGSEQYWRLAVPSGKSQVVFTISGGTGDADLYVRSGSRPTTTTYNCRPYLSGNNETCTITNPVAGDWYVMIRGYSAFSGVSLTGQY